MSSELAWVICREHWTYSRENSPALEWWFDQHRSCVREWMSTAEMHATLGV